MILLFGCRFSVKQLFVDYIACSVRWIHMLTHVGEVEVEVEDKVFWATGKQA